MEAKKLEIFNFIINVIEKRIFLRSAFAIYYECLKNINQNLGDSYAGLINEVVEQLPLENNYIQNLLASIYLMTPHSSLDYPKIFFMAVRSPKIYKIVAKIM